MKARSGGTAVAVMMIGWLISVGVAASGSTTSTGSSGAVVPRLAPRVFAAQAGQAATPRKPVMSDEVFKNVQVLKGIPVDDFMATMGFMASALGFDCDSCHESAGTDKVAWEADGSSNKRMARRMILMMQTINSANFGGAQMVTCYTCHRGRDIPIVTPAMDTWYGEPVQEFDDVLRPETGGPTVDRILDKYLNAIGGAQRLAGLKSVVAQGTSVGFGGFGGGGRVQVFAQAPDKRATYIVFPDDPGRGDSTRTYDGRTGWITNPRAAIQRYELTGTELDGARVDAQLTFPTQIKQALANLHVGPSTTIKDKDVQVLQGGGPRGMLVTLYFDQESGLLVRVVRSGRSPIGRLPTQVDYSDYRDVGGIKFPFQSIFSWLDGRTNFQLTNVQLNVPIDAAKFNEPTGQAK